MPGYPGAPEHTWGKDAAECPACRYIQARADAAEAAQPATPPWTDPAEAGTPAPPTEDDWRDVMGIDGPAEPQEGTCSDACCPDFTAPPIPPARLTHELTVDEALILKIRTGVAPWFLSPHVPDYQTGDAVMFYTDSDGGTLPRAAATISHIATPATNPGLKRGWVLVSLTNVYSTQEPGD